MYTKKGASQAGGTLNFISCKQRLLSELTV